mmetsp:Transcript_84772/g.237371  ORF Transcript_84772/g.237371 Transcript_84772/m.237371 type:complete len:573 (-) Transcript_84772:144-1862(-)
MTPLMAPAVSRRPLRRPRGGRGSDGPSGRRCTSWPSLWAAGCCLVAATTQVEGANPPPNQFWFAGACDAKKYLNGLLFDKLGSTANGSPFYKAKDQEYYIYYDEDCGRNNDGTKRWILDSDRPSVTRMTDLDGDFNCSYIARINWDNGHTPPYLDDWWMECSNGVWATRKVALLEITSTSTSTSVTTTTMTSTTATTTTLSTTTGTMTSTTRTGTTTTETTTTTRRWFALTGACEHKGFLNDLVFVEAGMTANGAPWFASLIASRQQPQFVYYDLDCNGGGDGVPRWIIDTSRPIENRTEDIDDDGACSYHARFDSMDPTFPPAAGQWYVSCATGWRREVLNMSSANLSVLEDHLPKPEVAPQPNGTSHPEATPEPPHAEANETEHDPVSEPTKPPAPSTTQAHDNDHDDPVMMTSIMISGACEELAELNGLDFKLEGTVASGSLYYKAAKSEHYIYHDRACHGHGETAVGARWIIAAHLPATLLKETSTNGDCHANATTSEGSAAELPAQAAWKMLCGKEWKDVKLNISVFTDVVDIPVGLGDGSLSSSAQGLFGCAAVAASMAALSALVL